MFVTSLFNERVVQALCLTLVHSLWEGLLLAIVTGILILLTRRSGAVIRYSLFSAALVLFILGSTYTFILQWDRAATSSAIGTLAQTQGQSSLSAPVEIAEVYGTIHEVILPGYRNIMDSTMGFFNEHAFLIVATWFVFFSMKLARIIVQLGAHQRLRHYKVHSPSTAWKNRVGELAHLLGIRMSVTLLESEIVTVPMMTGFLKPVILLPFSLLSQLPPAEVEAILLHELAHIRRGDYFVNIIFICAENLFFFNPGVLWICSLIREERENCCDDIAIRQAGSKKEFISALVSFQRYDRNAGVAAISFPGSGNHLLQRVRRIVYRDDKKLDGKEKFFLVFCFIVAGMLMLAYTHASPERRKSKPVSAFHMIKDTLPGEEANARDSAVRHAQAWQDAADSVAPPGAKGNKADEKNKTKEEKALIKKEIKEREKNWKKKEQADEMKGKKDEMKERMYEQEAKEDMERQEMKEQIEKQEKKEMEERKEMKELTEKQEIKELTEMQEMKERTEKSEIKERKQIQKALKDIQEMKERAEASEMKEEVQLAERDRIKDSVMGRHISNSIRANQKILVPIIDELVSKRLIDDRNGVFSFSLDNDELIINGVRQPDKVQADFRQKFLGSPKDRVTYSRDKDKNESATINIHRGKDDE